MSDDTDDETPRCPKCDSERVAIEALPLNEDPIIFVCRSCGYVFEEDGTL